MVALSVEVRSVREVQGRVEMLGDNKGGMGGCDGI